MKYSRVKIAAIGYELAPNVVTSAEIEEQLGTLYDSLKLRRGQLERLTGVSERRYWDSGQVIWQPAAKAGHKALQLGAISPSDIGMLVYGGVCRDNLEPATACAAAHDLAIGPFAEVLDISNACLGVLSGMVHIANAIELGQIRAGMVVSCESAREIVDQTIERLLRDPDLTTFKKSLATLTGGSGAVAVLLAEESLVKDGHRLLGGVAKTLPQHHGLCRWGPATGVSATAPMAMETNAAAVLEHGVVMGAETWRALRSHLGWGEGKPDRIICHQVGSWHRNAILKAFEFPAGNDYATFAYLGNIGTASLPVTAAIAGERGFLEPGHQVGFCGIGSGLNCLFLGIEW
ncbi:MAG: 3-oxoacyl-ACP synthase III [Planctomycetes bacterium]|nr:3-oxoacyl-ACP synthase III [Planctomycetota bacterium]